MVNTELPRKGSRSEQEIFFFLLAGRLQARLGTAGLALVGLLTLSGLVWLSMSLAVRFYKKREF